MPLPIKLEEDAGKYTPVVYLLLKPATISLNAECFNLGVSYIMTHQTWKSGKAIRSDPVTYS